MDQSRQEPMGEQEHLKWTNLTRSSQFKLVTGLKAEQSGTEPVEARSTRADWLWLVSHGIKRILQVSGCQPDSKERFWCELHQSLFDSCRDKTHTHTHTLVSFLFPWSLSRRGQKIWLMHRQSAYENVMSKHGSTRRWMGRRGRESPPCFKVRHLIPGEESRSCLPKCSSPPPFPFPTLPHLLPLQFLPLPIKDLWPAS